MRLNQLVRAGMGSMKSVSRGYGGSFGGFYDPAARGGKNWAAEVGNGWDNSLFYAANMYAWNALTEVDIYVKRPKAQSWGEVPNHPITQLLNTPVPWYDGATLIGGWVVSELSGLTGGSYTYKHRSTAQRLIGLEYIPHFAIEPYVRPGSGNFIDSYRLAVAGGFQPVDPKNILYQRFGFMNPRHVQKSVGPLAAVLMEVATDIEAARYTAAILENMGVTPNVISPHMTDESGKPFAYTDDQRDQIQQMVNEGTTGDLRGSTLVSPLPLRVDQLGMDISKLDLEAIRNIPEERVCAALRIPPVVLNLGTGIEQSNNRASAGAAAKAAARDFTKPYMRRKAAQLTADLVPELGEPGDIVCFRIEDIEALQEDKTEVAKRDKLECETYKTVNEKREEYGLKALPDGDRLLSNVSRETSDESDDDENRSERQRRR